MDQELVKFAASLGVGGVLAFGMFMYYRRDMKTYTDTLERLSNQWEGQSSALLKVVTDNTAAMVANTETIRALHRRMDVAEEALRSLGLPFSESHRKKVRED